MSSMLQRAYGRDRQRYPAAIGCLMWWGLFGACLAGYLVFFFIMSLFKEELGSSQLCAGSQEKFVSWLGLSFMPVPAFTYWARAGN